MRGFNAALIAVAIVLLAWYLAPKSTDGFAMPVSACNVPCGLNSSSHSAIEKACAADAPQDPSWTSPPLTCFSLSGDAAAQCRLCHDYANRDGVNRQKASNYNSGQAVPECGDARAEGRACTRQDVWLYNTGHECKSACGRGE